jgi:hypothetical protein
VDGESSGYIPGGAYGQCPRCGLVDRLNAMHKEWTGARVCKDCLDPRPEDTLPPCVGPEGLPRPDALPKMPEIEQQRITAEDL